MKFSIIIPVYNCEKYIEECVESIISSSGTDDYEILLIDDGSPDNSGMICDTLSGQYDQVKAYHKQNGGAADARNFGLDKASGDYVLFIDGDDTLDSSALNSIAEVLKHNPCDMVVFGMSFDYYRKNTLIRNELLSCRFSGLKIKDDVLNDFRSYFEDNTLSSACNKVFCRDTIQDNLLRFNKGMTLYEDLAFVLKYLSHTKTFFFINQPYYHYRHDLDNYHIHLRVDDLARLQANLDSLSEIMIPLNQYANNNDIISIDANLYLSLLDIHFLNFKEKITDEKKSVLEYISSPFLEEVLKEGAELDPHLRSLYERLQAGRYKELQAEYRKRRRKRAIKSTIKKVLHR